MERLSSSAVISWEFEAGTVTMTIAFSTAHLSVRELHDVVNRIKGVVGVEDDDPASGEGELALDAPESGDEVAIRERCRDVSGDAKFASTPVWYVHECGAHYNRSFVRVK